MRFRGGGGNSAQKCVAPISPRKARKIFSPSFFSCQDGLSWHLCPWETSQDSVLLGPPTGVVPWASYGHCIAIAMLQLAITRYKITLFSLDCYIVDVLAE